MSSNYTGNPTATEAPAAAPSPGTAPIIVLPSDGDAASAASVAQALKCLADYVAFLQSDVQRSHFTEEWMVSQTNFATAGLLTNQPSWSVTASGTPTGLSTATGTSAYPSNTMKINPGTASSKSLYVYSTQAFVAPSFSNLVLTLQFDALLTANSNCATYFGLVAGTDPAASNGVWFRYDPNVSADTVWRAVTKNTTSTDTSTGVAPLFTTAMQNFKIVLSGTTSAKFYINGNLVATNTTNMPTANMSLLFGANTSSANTCIPTVGPIYCSWNRT